MPVLHHPAKALHAAQAGGGRLFYPAVSSGYFVSPRVALCFVGCSDDDADAWLAFHAAAGDGCLAVPDRHSVWLVRPLPDGRAELLLGQIGQACADPARAQARVQQLQREQGPDAEVSLWTWWPTQLH